MARERQRERFKQNGMLNKQMGIVEIKRFCELDEAGMRLLEKAAEKYELSARAYTRVLRTARTIADLEVADKISCGHLAEALSYRMRR
jgi:magnesium chelatase family protein